MVSVSYTFNTLGSDLPGSQTKDLEFELNSEEGV